MREPPLSAAPIDANWPMYGLVDDVRAALAVLMRDGSPFAIATLVGADGPSPRPVGAQMVVGSQGVAGHVSGGCVEGSVVLIGEEVAKSGVPRVVKFGQGGPFADVRLTCGTTIEVLVEPAPEASWNAVLQAAEVREPIVRIASRSGPASIRKAQPGDPQYWSEGGQFAKRYDPPLRLVVFGRDPVALATVAAARFIEMETTLVRRLGPPEGPSGFSGRYLTCETAAALEQVRLDAWTAVVTTTHDLGEDHEVLRAALPSDAFFVGALGSKTKRNERLQMLAREGLDPLTAERLHAPIGLDIGAKSATEIGVAIVSAIIRAYRSRP